MTEELLLRIPDKDDPYLPPGTPTVLPTPLEPGAKVTGLW